MEVGAYLFVYGTLMGRMPDRAVNRLLRQQARDVGLAWVHVYQGRRPSGRPQNAWHV